ncbi:hypothetical protein U0035_03760 [Niabella yanshanensis]|uniref:DUF4595 domain-containing protein n=1 Tax=Niabella yanshanensis TaxID=577386 RepID=A0ABZ0WB09_9BACT|nr:hypothetical protein [Niabella yanshanensis]WQD39266.1 hypothetical protein U0035_03760 [Niabella yanshanensis]
MKFSNILFVLLVIVVVGYGCKKGELGEPKRMPVNVPHVPNVLNMFKVKLTLHKSQPHAMGDDDVVNLGPADSVLIDYTIESPEEDMYQVALYKTGGGLPQQRIAITDGMNRRTYSGKITFYAKDLGEGSATTYRIWANDRNGVYLGDGGRKLTINVSSDMRFYTNRWLFAHDTLEQKENSYVSLSDGRLYSYTTGAAHSASIDLGMYAKYERTGTYQLIDMNGDGTPDTAWSATRVNYLYSLSANPLPFVGYDISSWTKRGTLFSKQNTGGNINDMLKKFNTSLKIETEARKQTLNLTRVPATAADGLKTPLAAGQYIYFKTPEGKYGVILVQSVNSDYRSKNYLQLTWRIQE